MSAGLITTGSLSSALRPLQQQWIKNYKLPETSYDKIMEVMKSSRYVEEDIKMSSFGLPTAVGQGEGTIYDSVQQLWNKIYRPVRYRHGFIITKDMLEDDHAGVTGQSLLNMLLDSFIHMKEMIAADVLVNGFSSELAGDGVAVFSASHTLDTGATYANKPAVDVALSEAALEDAINAIMGFVDERGLPANIAADRLILPLNSQFDITRILKSELRSGVFANDTNALRMMGMFKNDPVIDRYLTDTNMWVIKTDCRNGGKFIVRQDVESAMDNDFDTENAKVRASMKVVAGVSDPRGYYGSSGL